ncbi:MAG: glycosyltransferase [Alphaproteobacteria bacterium]
MFAPALDMQADITIAHDLPMLPVACEAAARCGGKVVYDSHELFPEREISVFERRMWRRLEEKFIHRADLVIITNPSAVQVLKERYGLAEVLIVENREWLPATLPPREKLFHRAFGLPQEARVLLYQGGLSAGRNLDRMVDAMAHVATPDLHLVVLGNGEMKEALKRRARGRANVHFHDAVAQGELLRFSMAADAGVIPYQPRCLNQKLCTPNKLYEFIVAGLPIAATDLPELHRLIGGHGLGVLGDTGDARRFAALIDALFAPATFEAARKAVANARPMLSWQQQEAIYAQRIGALLDGEVDSARATA